MFVVYACARYQVNPKVSHLHAVKKIFRYLKGQPKLGLWYPKHSPFDLVAYTNSDYAGASLDRKSTIGGCQFLGYRLISWQCKKQTVVANSTTKAEYVAASSCCINLLLLLKVNAARHNLQLLVNVNATTAKVKTINGESQLHARVDGKKIIITESTVRRDLQLEDVEGVDCLRFVQRIFLDQQLDDMSIHKRIYVAHTKKIFRNMRRAGKCFSGRDTPLFQTMVVQAQAKMGKSSTNPTDSHNTPTIIQPSTSQPQMKQRSKRPKRKDIQVPQPSGPRINLADEVVIEEMDDSLVRAATTASSLEAEQDSDSGPKRQDTIGDTIAQTRFENVSKTSNDSLLARVNTPRSDEDRLKLNELMKICTKLQQRVLDLENTKTAQAQEITSLKLRVKKLEKKGGSRTHKLKRLYKVGRSARVVSSDEASLGDQEDASKQGWKIDDIDNDAEITLVDETQWRYGDDLMFDACVLYGEEMFAGQDMAEKEINVAEKEVSTADPVTTAGEVVATASVEISTASPTETIIADDLTLAQSLIEIRSAKPKVKGAVIGEQSESITRTRPQQLPSKDKGKAIMEELEKPTKRKDQIRHDDEVAQRLQAQLQAELKEEYRIVRQREEEANIVSWDNMQAMIDVND
ncbi:hypothetical protein Tco_1355512 [Tanacetum coccineum]